MTTQDPAATTGVGRLGPHVGRVLDFDEDRGLGIVGSGDVQWMFHCTSITDGSRRIEVGREVAFQVRAGGPGRWEAAAIAPVSGPLH